MNRRRLGSEEPARATQEEHWLQAASGTQRTSGFLWLLLLGLLLFPACSKDPTAPSAGEEAEASSPQTARSEVECGPVRVVLAVTPTQARLSDEPVLTLRIDFQQGVKVRKPALTGSLGDFVLRDFRQPLPRTQGDREILEQSYTLEPTRSGKLSIEPVSVAFTDSRPGGDGKEHVVQTEGLSVEIHSVVDSDAPSLGDLRPAELPLELPAPPEEHSRWLLVAAALGAIALAGFFWWRRRRRRAAEVVRSPREQALESLAWLAEDRLAQRDVKRFYVELTGIVRRYIEQTTGVHAPEQTTEEFLREIGRSKRILSPGEGTSGEEASRDWLASPALVSALKDFLESADLVKFAAHRPQEKDIAGSFERAERFVLMDSAEPKEVAP